jgi:hypothetical protein
MIMNENNNTKKQTRKASVIVGDKIAETVYDPVMMKTQFATFTDGKVAYVEAVTFNKEDIYPLDAKNDIVSKNVVLLPSLATEYGTEAELIQEIQTFIHKYLDITPMFERIAAYYAMFSWLFDRFNELPYLRAIGDFGSGKTRFLQVIGSVCYRPIFTGGATTPSPIFRILNELKGTLVLDEADFKSSEMSDDIVKILNSGYQRGIAVLRSEGKGVFEVKAYDVFSPKVIATRETFNDKALESRFLVEEMGRGTLRTDIPRRLSDEFYDESRAIRNKLLMWRFHNFNKPLVFDDAPLEGIHPRLHQIIIPLLTIIESEEMKASLKEFVQKYNQELIADRGMSWESDIIFAILKIEREKKTDSMTVKEITDFVNAAIDLSDDTLQTRKVGWILRARLQLKTYKTRKGYTLSLSKNKDKLVFWKDRYGITEADLSGECVNDVNVVETAIETANIGF